LNVQINPAFADEDDVSPSVDTVKSRSDDELIDDSGEDVPVKAQKKQRDVSSIQPKQLKLFQEKDKILMKFFTKVFSFAVSS